MNYNLKFPKNLPMKAWFRIRWEKEKGDLLKQGDVVLTISYLHDSTEVKAPYDGMLISKGWLRENFHRKGSESPSLGVIATDDIFIEKSQNIWDDIYWSFRLLHALTLVSQEEDSNAFIAKCFSWISIFCASCIFAPITAIYSYGWNGFFWSIPMVLILIIAICNIFIIPDLRLLKWFNESRKIPQLRETITSLKQKKKEYSEKLDNYEADIVNMKQWLEEEREKSSFLEKNTENLKEASENSSNLSSQIIENLESKIADKNNELAYTISEKDKAILELHKSLKLQEKTNNELAEEILALDAKLINSQRKSKILLEEIEHKSLTEFEVDGLIRHLSERLLTDERIRITDSEAAVLYGLMQEKVPDKERMKELSLIPHEELRVRQAQMINERYSKLITEVEQRAEKGEISKTEARLSANNYRVMRERELGTGA